MKGGMYDEERFPLWSVLRTELHVSGRKSSRHTADEEYQARLRIHSAVCSNKTRRVRKKATRSLYRISRIRISLYSPVCSSFSSSNVPFSGSVSSGISWVQENRSPSHFTMSRSPSQSSNTSRIVILSSIKATRAFYDTWLIIHSSPNLQQEQRYRFLLPSLQTNKIG